MSTRQNIIVILMAGIIFNTGLVFCGEVPVDFDNPQQNNLIELINSYNIETIPVPEINYFGEQPYIITPVEPTSGPNNIPDFAYASIHRPPIIYPGSEFTNRYKCTGPVGGLWHVCDYYKFDTVISGHEHNGDVPEYYTDASTTTYPPLPSPICAKNIPINSSIVWFLKAPNFATRATHRAVFWGACTDELKGVIDIKVPGLIELEPGPGYELVTLSTHPNNHYGKKKLINVVRNIAADYRREFSNAPLLKIMDISLPWGGLFDIGPEDGESDWQYWKPPHYGHTTGENADISKDAVPEANQKKLIEIMCRYTPMVHEEKLGRKNVYEIFVFSPRERSSQISLKEIGPTLCK